MATILVLALVNRKIKAEILFLHYEKYTYYIPYHFIS